MVAVMYDPNLRGSLREPPPRRVVFTNLIDHMACEGLLHNLDALMADTRRPGNVATLVNVVADAMERAAGILRGRLGALGLFTSCRDSCIGNEACSSLCTSCLRCARRAESSLLYVRQIFGLIAETYAPMHCHTLPSLLLYQEC